MQEEVFTFYTQGSNMKTFYVINIRWSIHRMLNLCSVYFKIYCKKWLLNIPHTKWLSEMAIALRFRIKRVQRTCTLTVCSYTRSFSMIFRCNSKRVLPGIFRMRFEIPRFFDVITLIKDLSENSRERYHQD